ncbi:MAG: sigma-54 dependent transcriptional regulator [Thermodesulfobacteriota bacterium]
MTEVKSEASHLSVLVVDDEVNIRKTLTLCLESRGHAVTAVSNPADAVSEAGRRVFDLAFVDLRLGTESGLDLIPQLLASCPWIKIVVVTAYASIDTAVEAMKRGAADYIPKPFTPEQVDIVTERAAAVRGMEQRIEALEEDINKLRPEISLESRHPAMQRALELARRAAPSDAAILIKGPSGTGKTVLSRAIHGWSRRADKPFAVISCPSLSPELLESELFGHVRGAFTGAVSDNPGRIAASEGGTLFLDEIGDLPLQLQPKLLRFLNDREYERVGDQKTRRADVRIISATNTDLEKAVKVGKFREDLFYRLNVIEITLPSLSERPDDLEGLAANMISFFGAQNHKRLRGFTPAAMTAIRNYSWPGNIRELRNVIERAAIICQGEVVGVENLPDSISPRKAPPGLGDPVPLSVIEESHIRRVVAETKTLQEASEILGIDQATLWRKRKQYGI